MRRTPLVTTCHKGLGASRRSDGLRSRDKVSQAGGRRRDTPSRTRPQLATLPAQSGCDSWAIRTLALIDTRMRFAPTIDRRLILVVRRVEDLGSAAAVWRLLRVRARRLGVDTPCYESVRRLVRGEQRRRSLLRSAVARLLALVRRLTRWVMALVGGVIRRREKAVPTGRTPRSPGDRPCPHRRRE